jgi:hypothetical protein
MSGSTAAVSYEQQIIDTAIDIITPVMEGSVIIAGEYAKACGRTMITGMDVRYAMCYAARNMVGQSVGTMFPEIYNDDNGSGDSSSGDDEDDDIEVEDEDEDENEEDAFTRYEGSDERMCGVNDAYDTWDDWEPYSPMEKMLKHAVDSQKN